MRRPLPLALIATALLAFPAAAVAHELFDHKPPGQSTTAPPQPTFTSGGPNAQWTLLGTIPTGNPHSDIDFFTRGGETYAAVGTLGTGPNSGGVTIVKLVNRAGEVKPTYVSGHGSATCFSDPSETLSLQHDVEATPKGGTILNTFVGKGAPAAEAQLIVDATDAPGRCHDQGFLGVQDAPQGGLELIDITDPTKPVEIGLTTHVGEAHTVNVDPRRPHIAYAISSDSTSYNTTTGARGNETSGNALDGFEVIDMKSCMYFPEDTTVQQKRELCRPKVYRYRYPRADMALGHTLRGTLYACHELEVYPEDKLTCASGQAMILLDIAKMFNDNGTPDDFTDDSVNGEPLPCATRPSKNNMPDPRLPSNPFRTGAMVVDCGHPDLQVSKWLKAGAPSVAGVEHIGSAFHQGRSALVQSATSPPFNSLQDIDFNHESELTTSRRFALATDERGGGVAPGGASCPSNTAPNSSGPSAPADNAIGNGGIHAYAIDRLQKSTPNTAAVAHQAYARNSRGEKAIYRAPIRTKPQGSLCTAHVFQQIPGQNRIFMGWYSQGTQVVDFVENPDGTIDFKEAGFFIPANANQWVSAIFKAEREPDGRFTYFGATGDFNVAEAGRNAIDVYKVTLPAPPVPAGGTGTRGEPAPAPAGGVGSATAGSGAKRCGVRAGFRSVEVRGRGRRLRIGLRRLERRPVTVDVFRQSAGDRVTGEARVARFTRRRGSFTWSGRGARDGVHIVRYTMSLPNRRRDVRRVAVERRKGRWFARPAYYQPASCGLIRSAKLERPVFGGRNTNALLISFHLGETSAVSLTIRDSRGRVVRRYRERTYTAGRTHRLRVRASLIRRTGLTRVEINARSGSTRATSLLAARKL